MREGGLLLVAVAAAAAAATAAAAAAPAAPSLACSLNPGRVGERQELACRLEGGGWDAGDAADVALLLLVPLPRGVGPDNAWLAAAAVAGAGGIVACGAGGPGPLAGSGVPPCPALAAGRAAAAPSPAALAACLPPAAAARASAAQSYLTTPLPAACTDEALPGRAQPALLAVAATAGTAPPTFTTALRARLAAPLPHSWLGGRAAAALSPPALVALHRANGSLAGLVAARGRRRWRPPVLGGPRAGRGGRGGRGLCHRGRGRGGRWGDGRGPPPGWGGRGAAQAAVKKGKPSCFLYTASQGEEGARRPTPSSAATPPLPLSLSQRPPPPPAAVCTTISTINTTPPATRPTRPARRQGDPPPACAGSTTRQ